MLTTILFVGACGWIFGAAQQHAKGTVEKAQVPKVIVVKEESPPADK